MIKRHELRLTTTSATGTESIGEAIGRRLKGGETIELASDLGGGKTTLVRGLARAAGSSDHVASPTFTLSKLYQAGNLHIHHFDFYRLQEAGIMRDEVRELIADPESVVIVEWSDIVQSVLPAERLTVNLAAAAAEDSRQIVLSYPDSLSYLVAEVRK